MILSIGLSLLVLARDFFGSENKAVNAKPAGEISGAMDLGASHFYQGLEEISGTAAKIKRNVELNQKVDTLLNKKHLTARDSLWLLQALKAPER